MLLYFRQKKIEKILKNDIAGDIMNKGKLEKLKIELESFRNKKGNIIPNELITLAEKLGRKKVKRGKEPTYESELLPKSRPLTIPKHSRALNKYTAGSILDQLDQDIFELEIIIKKVNKL